MSEPTWKDRVAEIVEDNWKKIVATLFGLIIAAIVIVWTDKTEGIAEEAIKDSAIIIELTGKVNGLTTAMSSLETQLGVTNGVLLQTNERLDTLIRLKLEENARRKDGGG